MRRILKTVAAIVVFVVVVAGSGMAWAYWRTTGSGSGSATIGDLQKVTILSATAGDFTGAKLYPGGTSNVVLRVSNPNTTSVHVVSVVLNGTITGSGGCSTTGITYTPPSGGASIPTGTSTLVLSGAVTMDNTSDSACQGQTFNIPVTLTVQP